MSFLSSARQVSSFMSTTRCFKYSVCEKSQCFLKQSIHRSSKYCIQASCSVRLEFVYSESDEINNLFHILPEPKSRNACVTFCLIHFMKFWKKLLKNPCLKDWPRWENVISLLFDLNFCKGASLLPFYNVITRPYGKSKPAPHCATALLTKGNNYGTTIDSLRLLWTRMKAPYRLVDFDKLAQDRYRV